MGAFVLLVLALARLLGGSARADAVSLAWEPSLDQPAMSFNLYCGLASRSYTAMVAVGNVTNADFPGLLPGVRYFFAVTAVDRAGLESGFSNEISYEIPLASQIPLGVLSSSANPALPGQVVAFSLFLSAAVPSGASPTGTAQLSIDGLEVGPPVPLRAGAADFNVAGLTQGAHRVVAEYSGDTDFAPATITLRPAQVIDTPPVAFPATLYGLSGGGRVPIADLLTNVEDADGDPIAFLGVSPVSAQGGTVTTAGQWLFYAPPPGSAGLSDAFSYQITDGLTAPVTGAVIVAAQTAVANVANLAILNLGDGTLGVCGQGAPGATYTIQYTAPPLPPTRWVTLGTTTADDSGAFVLIQTAVTGPRLYRAVGP